MEPKEVYRNLRTLRPTRDGLEYRLKGERGWHSVRKDSDLYRYLMRQAGGEDAPRFGPVTRERIADITPGEAASRAADISMENPRLSPGEALAAAYAERTYGVPVPAGGGQVATETALELARLHRKERMMPVREVLKGEEQARIRGIVEGPPKIPQEKAPEPMPQIAKPEEAKKWLAVRTGFGVTKGQLYTDAERNALLSAKGMPARDYLVMTSEARKEQVYSNKVVQFLLTVPGKIIDFTFRATETPPSSLPSHYVTNPTQKKLLKQVEHLTGSAKDFQTGAAGGLIAAIASIPALVIGLAADPKQTGEDVVRGVFQSVKNFATPHIPGTQRGMDTMVLIMTALGVRSALGAAKGAIKSVSGTKAPEIVKSWRGVAVDELKSNLKDAKATPKTITDITKAADKLADGVEKGNKRTIGAAAQNILDAVNKDASIDPVIKTMIEDGGKYLKDNASRLAKTKTITEANIRIASDMYDTAIGAKAALKGEALKLWEPTGKWERAYRLSIEDIERRVGKLGKAKTWGQAESELTKLQKDLTNVDWFKQSRESFREEMRQPSWQDAAADYQVQLRLQRLIERMPSTRRANLYKALDKVGESRAEALREMWEYLEEVYGKKNLENYMRTGEWLDKPPEGLEYTVKGAKDASEIVDKIKRQGDAAKEVEAALDEINRILRDNKYRPAKSPLKEKPSPPEKPGRGRVAVKERVEVKTRVRPKTAQEIAELMKTKAKPKVRPSAFPGIEPKTKAYTSPEVTPILHAIATVLAGTGLTVLKPMPTTGVIVETLARPGVKISPAPAPMPAPMPAPAPMPLPAPAPMPSPIPAPMPLPSTMPAPMPVPTPTPAPKVRPEVRPSVKPQVRPMIETQKALLTERAIPRRGIPKITKVEPTEEQLKTATTWPQGFGWWINYTGSDGKPYLYFKYGQEAPPGAKMVQQGKGEAYRGIQQHIGIRPTRFRHVMGITTVDIDQPLRRPGRVGAIKFSVRRLPLTGTKSALPNKGIRRRITPKKKGVSK